MKFETMKIGNAHYVVKNGVTSTLSVAQIKGGAWAILAPSIAYTRATKTKALAFVAKEMGDWYTTAEAADRLVEMGIFDVAPSAQEVCTWARLGLLPGAIKITGKVKGGRGGAWRIPGKALEAFAERRG